jgi:hypothetical protein
MAGKGTEMEAKDYSVFCPKVLAGIDTGRIPETIIDRSIVIHMRRRKDGETVDRLRVRFAEQELGCLQDDLARWGTSKSAELAAAVPDLPAELSDRKADAWEPLLAIADLAGWSQTARDAALELSVKVEDGVSRGSLLLAAIKMAMEGREVISTVDLLAVINADDELPFGGWNDGAGIGSRDLAKILKPYGVTSKTVRVTDKKTLKGYRRCDLQDAWDRYLSIRPSQVTSSVTENRTKHGDVTDVTRVTPREGRRTETASGTPSPGKGNKGNNGNTGQQPPLEPSIGPKTNPLKTEAPSRDGAEDDPGACTPSARAANGAGATPARVTATTESHIEAAPWDDAELESMRLDFEAEVAERAA